MNKNTAHVVWFKEVTKKDIPLVGGKGANLGEMTQAKIPVPNGFVVTAKAYFDFLKSTSLKQKILTELSGLDVDDSTKLQAASKTIRTAILAAKMPDALAAQIKEYYQTLCGNSDRYVAVRSSATAEDLPDASFAGQQDTYLNILGYKDVVKNVQKCWASLFGSRAIFYRQTQGFDHFKVGIAVPIQLMVQSDVSGIMFTVNPVTNNLEELSIEAAFGLGQPIVSGELTPDQYLITKKTGKILSKFISNQTWQFTMAGNVPVSKKYQKVQKFQNKHILELAKVGMDIEKHYGKPQDIEWAFEDGKIYIVQSRPITTLGESKVEKVTSLDKSKKGKLLLEGLAASPGIASGKVVILKNAREISRVKDGDILVATMTNPDYVPAMRRARAIVTDEGGRTSHAAIVSRELGIPAVVGSGMATKMLTQGEIVTVDGAEGKIYEGNITILSDAVEESIDTSNLHTATKVYMNLAEPYLAAEMAKQHVDGIGLLRAEFMIADIGKHPRAFIDEKKSKDFVDQLTEGLTTFVEAFSPRPVVYRFTDFRTNEYKGLKGGAKYEQDEANPMIGFRGVSRYLADADVFKLEIEAIKKVRNKKGFKNLHVMFPFVRTLKQLEEVKKLMGTLGLRRSPNFKVWMMVEIPSNVILLDQFIDIGIDGVSVGTNDLTMLTLGIDRDNAKVAPDYSELDGAVMASLEKIVTTCKRRKITCSICGQAPSVYPEIVEKLVEWGITSVSVSPDVLDKTRKIVSDVEKKVLSKAHPKKKSYKP